MIVYYVNNSIHQIPSFIYIARVLGGIVFTDGPASFETLREFYPDVPAEYYPTMAELRARLDQLRPEAVVQPDYTRRELALPFDTVHVQVFHGTSDKSYGISQRVRDFDLLLLPGERSRLTMQAAGLLTPDNYVVVGYPKVDRVFNGELPRETAIQRLGLDATRPTVLYAPTWRDNKQNSSLRRFGAEVLTTVPAEYNLIVKLHPNTKHYDRKYYPLIERLSNQKTNVLLLDYEHDVIPVMAAADALICDISAVSHEYLAFDRPLIFLDARILPIGKGKTWVWQSGEVIKSRGQVWKAVARALADPRRYAAERKAVREEIYYKPDGHAAERAAQAIRAYLNRHTK